MKRTKIVDIFNPELIGSDVCVKGWVRTRRGNKNVQFVALNDGSTIKNVQIVFDLTKFSEEELKPITSKLDERLAQKSEENKVNNGATVESFSELTAKLKRINQLI